MTQSAYVAGGCFWGLEELFRTQPGVVDTEVGYAGGSNSNPSYEHHPEHAEVLQISYDDTKITYLQILDYFFRIHDPTTLNRQGNDVGSSYRSVIFYTNEAQREKAEASKKKIEDHFQQPTSTEIQPAFPFYPAEDYHQHYAEKNPLRYKFYRYTCGRDQRLAKVWGKS